MAAEYTIIQIQPWTYINTVGQTVDGFRTWFTIPNMTPTFYVDTPTDVPATIKTKILDRVKNLNSLMS